MARGREEIHQSDIDDATKQNVEGDYFLMASKFNNPELSVQYHPHNLGLMNDSQSKRELKDNDEFDNYGDLEF
ncbi:hypothetical protein DAPPUDRAFT_238414 [Daphnia pulex]|uniref:Uncharacterized protein n=1 Tax=Daphnia pulex TaxID=6669 RepID=E9G6C2_DAPPU|nr:hypothetical protein DAPPUDRAFT_238414 [Daphnia pulex]|eukprot:EFX84910.1 hypothetical protein DAPPUDRAFT_238414 [Daphnia pulex]